MALNTIFLSIASTLSTFDLSHATDSEGKIVPVEEKWNEAGTVLQVMPFVCDVQVREGWRGILETCNPEV